MDLNVLDPALFVPQTQHGLPDPSTTHQDLLLAADLNNLPRLPNQIGGVTIANLHSHSSPHNPDTSRSPLHDRSRATSTTGHPHGCGSLQQSHAFDLRNQYLLQQQLDTSCEATPLHHQFFTTPSYSTWHPTPARSQASRLIQTTVRSRLGNGNTSTNYPKFHCGEPGCNFYRTDGDNLNGRYAMAKHYKQSHPDLRFEPSRLVSSHKGQKCYRMVIRSTNGQDSTASILENPNCGNAAPVQDVVIDPALLTASIPGIPQHTHAQNVEANTISARRGQYIQPVLPCLLERPFTRVPDLHVPEEELKNDIRAVRNACDIEMLKVRQLLLSHCRITGRSAEQFLALRTKFFLHWIQKAQEYITRISGPLDAIFSEVGSWNDIVMEVGMMFFSATQRSYLPQNGIIPDGVTLNEAESGRRKLCCELQAIKLCFEFCQVMSSTCGRIYRMDRLREQREAMLNGAT